MPRGHRDRLSDILTAIADIRADTLGMDLAAFEKCPVIVRSVLYSIGVIGEAVKAIDPDFKAAHPDIPWRHRRTPRPHRPRIFPHHHSAHLGCGPR